MTAAPDPDSPDSARKVRVFRLNDGRTELGYAFAEVIDLMTIDHDVIPATVAGPVAGVTLIGGEPAELIDAHWLFAEHRGSDSRVGAPLVCRLPADDPWMQNILRPIVEAAGYVVIADSDDAAADLTIVGDSHDATTAAGEGGRLLRLATDPDAADGKDSIYRYDRASLLIALKSTGTGR